MNENKARPVLNVFDLNPELDHPDGVFERFHGAWKRVNEAVPSGSSNSADVNFTSSEEAFFEFVDAMLFQILHKPHTKDQVRRG